MDFQYYLRHRLICMYVCMYVFQYPSGDIFIRFPPWYTQVPVMLCVGSQPLNDTVALYPVPYCTVFRNYEYSFLYHLNYLLQGVYRVDGTMNGRGK